MLIVLTVVESCNVDIWLVVPGTNNVVILRDDDYIAGREGWYNGSVRKSISKQLEKYGNMFSDQEMNVETIKNWPLQLRAVVRGIAECTYRLVETYSVHQPKISQTPTYATGLSSIFVYLRHYPLAFDDERNCART